MAELNAKSRHALPDSAFVIVKTVDGKKVRKYPIQDREHAIAAIARVKEHGTPAEKGKVFHAVCRKYDLDWCETHNHTTGEEKKKSSD